MQLRCARLFTGTIDGAQEAVRLLRRHRTLFWLPMRCYSVPLLLIAAMCSSLRLQPDHAAGRGGTCVDRSWYDDHIGEPFGERIIVGKYPKRTLILVGRAEQIAFQGYEGADRDVFGDMDPCRAACGARRATLISQPKGAAAPTRWSLPRTRLAANGVQSSAGRTWSMCRRWVYDMLLALHRTEQRIRPQNEPEKSGSTC